MAANSITAANGAIADLTVGRLKIISYPVSNGSMTMTDGIATATITHNLGRIVIPVIYWDSPDSSSLIGYQAKSIILTFEDTNSFAFQMRAVSNAGALYSGTVYYQYLYL